MQHGINTASHHDDCCRSTPPAFATFFSSCSPVFFIHAFFPPQLHHPSTLHFLQLPSQSYIQHLLFTHHFHDGLLVAAISRRSLSNQGSPIQRITLFSPHPLDLQVPTFPGYEDSDEESDGGSDYEEEPTETSETSGSAGSGKSKRKQSNTRSKKDGAAKKPKKAKKTEPSDHHNSHFQKGYAPDARVTEKQVRQVLMAPVQIKLFPSHLHKITTHFDGTIYIRSFLGHCTNCSFMFAESTTNLEQNVRGCHIVPLSSLSSHTLLSLVQIVSLNCRTL